jgi:hypothetical protein
LRGLNGLQDGLKLRAWLIAESHQIIPGQQWGRDQRFVGELFDLARQEFVIRKIAVAGLAVDFVESEFVCDGGSGEKAF